MKNIAGRATLFFSAGCIGGLANILTVWFFGGLGLTAMMGVSLTVPVTSAVLYQRLVWGGIWGMLLFIPMKTRSAVLSGFLISIFPTLVQLFVVFPFKAGKGVAGLELGMLTPLLVVLFNAAWGISASLWRKYTTA